MKLSEKGKRKILDNRYWFMNEFEPDDFEDCVVLTVEEAKAVNEAIEWLCSTLEDYEREHDNTPALIEGWNQMDFLEHRIEQAEMSKQST